MDSRKDLWRSEPRGDSGGSGWRKEAVETYDAGSKIGSFGCNVKRYPIATEVHMGHHWQPTVYRQPTLSTDTVVDSSFSTMSAVSVDWQPSKPQRISNKRTNILCFWHPYPMTRSGSKLMFPSVCVFRRGLRRPTRVRAEAFSDWLAADFLFISASVMRDVSSQCCLQT